MSHRKKLAALIVACAATLAPDAHAQIAISPLADSAPPRVSLFTGRDFAALAGIAAAVAAIAPADKSVARAFQRPGIQSNSGVKSTLNAFNGVGDPGALVFSAVTYFVGLGTHSRSIASLGMHTGEAVVLGGVLAEALKGAVGRARPSVDVTNARDFHSWKGFSSDNFASFPSGEVTVAFAAATAASREVGRSWPGASRYVTPATFAAATLVGVARLYRNQHWASDVVAGAGLGTLSGILFNRYNRNYPDNVFNRLFLPTSIVPDHRGLSASWLIPLH